MPVNYVDLSAQMLAMKYGLRIHCMGTSMFPTMKPGDFVVIQPVRPDELAIGDIVAFRKCEKIIAHRLIRRQKIDDSGRTLVTKGDSRAVSDRPINGQCVLGKVIVIEKGGQLVKIDSRAWHLANRIIARYSLLLEIIYLKITYPLEIRAGNSRLKNRALGCIWSARLLPLRLFLYACFGLKSLRRSLPFQAG